MSPEFLDWYDMNERRLTGDPKQAAWLASEWAQGRVPIVSVDPDNHTHPIEFPAGRKPAAAIVVGLFPSRQEGKPEELLMDLIGRVQPRDYHSTTEEQRVEIIDMLKRAISAVEDWRTP